MDLLEEKYRPLQYEDFIGNEESKNKLKAWINSFKDPKVDPKLKKFFIISGPTGSGKTSLGRLAFSVENFFIVEFNESDVKKDIFEKIKVTGQINNVCHQMDSRCGSTAVIIENGENLFNESPTFDKFYEILSGNVPVIVIFNGILKKKFKKFKLIPIIELQLLTEKELIPYILKISKEESIDIDKDAIRSIIASSRGDLRKILHFLKIMSYKNKKFTKENIDMIIENSESDAFFEAKDVVRQIFQEGIQTKTIDEKINVCYSDQYLIEQLIFTHLPDVLQLNEESKDKMSYEKYIELIEYMILSDTITEFIQRNQSWDLKELSVTFSCIGSDIMIPKNKKFKMRKNDINNLQLNTVKNMSTYKESMQDPIEYPFIFKNIIYPETERTKMLDNLEYSTYSKFCNLYKLKKRPESYFIKKEPIFVKRIEE